MSLAGIERIKELLVDEDAFATSLLALCLDEYGTEIFEWEPATLWMQLAEDFGSPLPRVNRDKIQALMTVHETDLALQDVDVFNSVCNALSGSEADFGKFDPLSPEEVLWGIYEILLNMDPDEGRFSDDIRAYIGVILNNNGVVDPVDVLRIGTGHVAVSALDEDQEIIGAVYEKDRSDNRALMRFLHARIRALLTELDSIELESRDDERWNDYSKQVASRADAFVDGAL